MYSGGLRKWITGRFGKGPAEPDNPESIMIYSASRRTDMPAFFPDELAGRVKRSRKLEAIVFWTKDIRNLARHPDLSRIAVSVPSIVQYTVTGLAGGRWEPHVPPLADQMDALVELASRLPNGAVQWRFDPVIPSPDLLDRFRRMKGRLESALGQLDGVTVSFPDPYRHAVARAAAAGMAWPAVELERKKEIVALLAEEFFPLPPGEPAPIRLCCQPELLELPCVRQAHCIDGALFEKLYALPLGGLPRDDGQRAQCGCTLSTDIGSYDMRCGHGCVYCYARRGEAGT